jgi:hypothetical protein
VSACASAASLAPETRTMPIPARPGAVAIAAIVSGDFIGGEYSGSPQPRRR